MYLTEAYRFYQRMTADPDSGMPPEGMSEENIAFKLVLSRDGELKEVISLCDSKGKPRRMMVPAAEKRANAIVPNFLWDNTGYALGVDGKGKAERTQKTFEAFKEKHITLAEKTQNPRLLALSRFLQTWNPEQFASLRDHEALLDQQIVFQIEGDNSYLHLQKDIQEIWTNILSQGEGKQGTCLITGKQGVIARTHPAIKGVPGAQSSGAALVSFTPDAFKSYGKDQSYNAPVSEVAARGYVAALNYLLRKDNKQCLDLGDTRAVFWSEKPSITESAFSILAGGRLSEEEKEKASPQDRELIEKIRSLLQQIRRGLPVDNELAALDGSVRFFLLGLAPNAARIVVRFWLSSSFGELALRVARHYADCAIEKRYPDDAEYPSLYAFLLTLAVQGKRENVPPVMGGQLARAVFSGLRYPESVYLAVLQRIHAEKQVSYLRASLIAGYLRRNYQRGDITMSLNPERTDVPYLLGRLFSLLEKAQRDALGAVNSSVKDKYLGAASATPAHVFPLLLRLVQNHIKKISQQNSKYGLSANKKIEDVIQGIEKFPPQLSLPEQGDFFIGYYHQCNANYAKKSEAAVEQSTL